MSLKKTEYKGRHRILLIFTPMRRISRRLHRAGDGAIRFVLETEETGLTAELQVTVIKSGENWYLGQECLCEEHPCYLETGFQEKILFLLSAKREDLEPAYSYLPARNTGIKIGRAFQNTIFYECCALVTPCHLEIFYAAQGWYIGEIAGAVYVNGKLVVREQQLTIGDTIDLYGLHILLLNGMMVCACLCGLCRIADEAITGKLPVCREAIPSGQTELSLKKHREEAYEFHKGEVEILLPEPIRQEAEQPLLLGVGPSVTMVLPMLFMAALSSRLMGERGSGFYYLSVIMSGCSAALALFWGCVNHFYRKKMYQAREQGRRKQYQQYLADLTCRLEEWQRDNREVLVQRYPPLSELINAKTGFLLWNRYYMQSDFLFLRLGMGRAPFQVCLKFQGKGKLLLPDKETAAAQRIAEQFSDIEPIPVGIDLKKMRQIGIANSESRKEAYEILLGVIGQLAACHSYTEVKVACFYHKTRWEDEQIVNCIKWMPHCWSSGRKQRLLAGDEQETAEILPLLTATIEAEREHGSIPWYVVVILDKELVMGEALYQSLAREEENCPASVIYAEKESAALPKSCRYQILKEQGMLHVICADEEEMRQNQVVPDDCNSRELEGYFRRMNSFLVKEEQAEEKLPEMVNFLELFQCKRVEELDCIKRWEHGHPEIRLRVPIGFRAGETPVYLDVHEKFHGPHGLIAGTTGSGKSELLQTYLLSLAVSFAPDMVNFCIIDYKGGGTGNALASLPHCAGVISNLSGREVYRALAAITSENRKRQKQLSQAGLNHVDAYLSLYREGRVTDAMPHLILVVDEFAELRKEEPEFMQEIISLSQVGRSLGIHLLLATQKPAGTVDDKIWSNSRFRLCLRVQDRQDSMDMLHNPGASTLTVPGQAYLQIGSREDCELIQTGYSAGMYQPEKETEKPAALLEITGKRMFMPELTVEKTQSQLEAVVSYVNQLTKEEKYRKAKQLWIREMPEYLTLERLSAYGGREEAFCQEADTLLLGLCDDPENQSQFPFIYNPQEQGHLAICGGPSTGKSTLLQTICWQITMGSGGKEALLAMASMGQENHDCFLQMPGCLGILKDPENMEIFLYHVGQLLQRRKKQLSGISCQIYNRSAKEPLPLIFFCIDNYGTIRGMLSKQQEELLERLASEGITYGIYLVMTASGAGEFSGKLFEKVKTTIALEMSDRFQYGDVLRQYHIRVLPKENCKGRGICRFGERILEFQAALCIDEPDDYRRMQKIAEAGEKRKEGQIRENKKTIQKFPVIYWEQSYGVFFQSAEEQCGKTKEVPLGYDMKTGEKVGYFAHPSNNLIITGRERGGRKDLLKCLMKGLRWQGREVVFVNAAELPEAQSTLMQVMTEHLASGQEKTMTCVLISDLGGFCHWLYSSGAERAARQQFWQEVAEGKRNIFLAGILMREQEQEAYGTPFFAALQKHAAGIHMGGNVAEQRVFSYGDLSYSQQNQTEKTGVGYYFSKNTGRTRKIFLPPWEEGESYDPCRCDSPCAGGML